MPLHIETRNVTLLPEWEARIDEKIASLQQHHPGLVHHFRVTIIGTQHHRHGLFEIHLVASIIGDTIVVKHRGERVRPTIVECFDALDRQLREYDRKRRQEVKHHEVPPPVVGTIAEIKLQEGYGYITTPDGREVYFHRNAVKNSDMEALAVGDLVEFGEEAGEKGLQATWVRRT